MNFINCSKGFQSCFDLIAEPANNIASLGYSYFVDELLNTQENYRSGVTSILTLKETVNSFHTGVYFQPFDPFLEHYNKFLEEIQNTGLLSYWYYLVLNPKGLKMKLDEIGPQVLTMEHLMVGFQVWFSALMTSVIAFIAEIGWKCLKSFMSKPRKTIVSHKKVRKPRPKVRKPRPKLRKPRPKVRKHRVVHTKLQKKHCARKAKVILVTAQKKIKTCQ